MKRKDLNLKLKTPRIVVVEYDDKRYKYPFNVNETVLLLGEIQNMKGHVVVVDNDNNVHWGYHPELFREAEDSDI